MSEKERLTKNHIGNARQRATWLAAAKLGRSVLSQFVRCEHSRCSAGVRNRSPDQLMSYEQTFKLLSYCRHPSAARTPVVKTLGTTAWHESSAHCRYLLAMYYRYCRYCRYSTAGIAALVASEVLQVQQVLAVEELQLLQYSRYSR